MEFKEYLKKLKKDTERPPNNEKELGFQAAIAIIYAKYLGYDQIAEITFKEVEGIDFGKQIQLSESERKKVFEIVGSCYKNNSSEFSEKEREEIQDSFIEWVEENNLSFGGGLK